MKLATFTDNGLTRIGVVQREEIIDLSGHPRLPAQMLRLLQSGADGLQAVRKAAARSTTRLRLSGVRMEAPISNSRKFLALGGSPQSHIDEVADLGVTAPKFQYWFNKQVTCINGPYDEIPRVSDTLDYERELVLVIGKRCRHVKGSEAREAIAGFTICNNVSVREWQMLSPTAMLGKFFDTHGPLGPWIVTPEELPGAHSLSIKTWENGKLRQNGNSSDLIYRFGEMLAEVTTAFTPEPGDLLATGRKQSRFCTNMQPLTWHEL